MSDTNEPQSNALDLQSLINLQKQYVLDLDRIPTGKQNISSLQSQVVELNEKLKNLDSLLLLYPYSLLLCITNINC